MASSGGRARAVANSRPDHLGAMAALRGGMHDREQDIEAFTAKQLALVELECAAEEMRSSMHDNAPGRVGCRAAGRGGVGNGGLPGARGTVARRAGGRPRKRY